MSDADAWVWFDTDRKSCDPDFGECFEEAIEGYAADDEEQRRAAWAVATRLRGEWHMPAVREKLGCLIPEWLHPKRDKAASRTRPGKASNGAAGLSLKAGKWELPVFQEENFLSGQMVSKGVIGFFENVL